MEGSNNPSPKLDGPARNMYQTDEEIHPHKTNRRKEKKEKKNRKNSKRNNSSEEQQSIDDECEAALAVHGLSEVAADESPMDLSCSN